MATSGELNVGKLKKFLDGFPDDTKIVLGQKDTDEIGLDCWANTYYPTNEMSGKDYHDVWIVLDHGKHWFDE